MLEDGVCRSEGNKLRLGYIGAGNFSNAFIFPQLSSHPVELLAICDLVREKAERAARQWGFRSVFTDFRRMLEEAQPDAVICIGGPKVHYEVGREVLSRGFPLYIQKSPAPTAEQTQELAHLAQEHQVVCHVGFNLRSSVAGLKAREIVRTEDFGPVALVVVRYGLVSGKTRRDAVFDQHCHAFDLLRWLGGEVDEMTVKAGCVEGDRGYVAAVRYASGAVGSVNFTSGQVATKEFLYFEVTGQSGHYLISHDFDLRYISPGKGDALWQLGNYGVPHGSLAWLGYVEDIANFLGAVRGVVEDRSPVADAVNTMRICEEVYAQLRAQGVEE